MRICLKCYKKLEHKMFTPYDYEWTKEGLRSTCCDSKTKDIDGRHYHKTVKHLKELARLEEWKALYNAPAAPGRS